MLLPGFARRRFAVAAAVAISLATAAAVPVRPSPAIARSSGVPYAAAQAARGGQLFAVNCSRCHGADLLGGGAPPLVGPTFRNRWEIRTLYRFVSRQMPADRRGGLSPGAYSAILAFLLQRNGFPAGPEPLTAARASSNTTKL